MQFCTFPYQIPNSFCDNDYINFYRLFSKKIKEVIIKNYNGIEIFLELVCLRNSLRVSRLGALLSSQLVQYYNRPCRCINNRRINLETKPWITFVLHWLKPKNYFDFWILRKLTSMNAFLAYFGPFISFVGWIFLWDFKHTTKYFSLVLLFFRNVH